MSRSDVGWILSAFGASALLFASLCIGSRLLHSNRETAASVIAATFDQGSPAPVVARSLAIERPALPSFGDDEVVAETQVASPPPASSGPGDAAPVEPMARAALVARPERSQTAGETPLWIQLLDVPEIDVTALQFGGRPILEHARELAAREAPAGQQDVPPPRGRGINETAARRRAATQQPPALLCQHRELSGLPWLKGDACRMSVEEATAWSSNLAELRAIANFGRLSRWADASLDPSIAAQRVPVLTQCLQAEEFPFRRALVQILGKLQGAAPARTALAQRALFDVDPDIRFLAMELLAERSREEARSIALAALRHPWPPAADHAAEMLVALNLREAVPDLVALLDQPDPKFASAATVRELVKVNHLRNCLLCHPPTQDPRELLPGLVPSLEREVPPPLSTQYYLQRSPGDLLVTAQVSYLRQDFSVSLPVTDKPGKWPVVQRYDFLVRTRPATAAETQRLRANPASYPQREAVLVALRRLTGREFGNSTAAWREILTGRGQAAEAAE